VTAWKQADLLGWTPPTPHFAGPAYAPALDHARLTLQHARIRDLMRDGRWRTLGEIAAATGDKEASISAQLRHLRRPKFGAWVVEKRRRGEGRRGLWEYRLLPGAANDGGDDAAGE
jgi:hypothetical protein